MSPFLFNCMVYVMIDCSFKIFDFLRLGNPSRLIGLIAWMPSFFITKSSYGWGITRANRVAVRHTRNERRLSR